MANEFVVGRRSNGKTVQLSPRYSWSTHNCSCQNKSKTGIVLYPSNTVYENDVLLVCESCYSYKSGNVTQHQQLANWYFGIYGNSKSFVFSSGFSMKANGELDFNVSSNAISSCPYHTENRVMGQLEQNVVRKVVDGKLYSYTAV